MPLTAIRVLCFLCSLMMNRVCPQDFQYSNINMNGRAHSRSGPVLSLLLILMLLSSPGRALGAQDSERPVFRWPVFRENSTLLPGMTSTFGEPRYDHFHNGIDIAGDADPVRPVYSGKLLFSRSRQDDPFHPVSGPGNYVIIDHGNGFRSGYYHLRPLTGSRPLMVRRNSTIGLIGNSGHSSGSHLHFNICRDYGNTCQNPFELLPPVQDQVAPLIGQLSIHVGEHITLISHSRPESIRLSKPYPILATVLDGGYRVGPARGIYKLIWKLNEQPEQRLLFSEICHRRTGWTLACTLTYDEVFQYGKYNLGELDFKKGPNQLILTVIDFAGNSTRREYSINVNRLY